jgi:hypothetical protein
VAEIIPRPAMYHLKIVAALVVMRVFSSWRFTGSAALLRITILLCLGVCLLSWSAGGSEVSAVLTVTDTPFAEQSTNSDGYPIDGTYLAEVAQESEPDDRLPKNSALLRNLVLVLFFWPVLWWLAATCWMRCRQEVCSHIRCWFHSMVHLHQRRGVATLFLGVFRL